MDMLFFRCCMTVKSDYSMAYTRCVWFEVETEKTFSGPVPSCWIIDGNLYWPPSNKAAAFFKRKEMPNVATWSKFKVIKEKLLTDDFKLARDEPDTSATETDFNDDEKEKRDHKPTSNADFVLFDDCEIDSDIEEPRQKRAKEASMELSIVDMYYQYKSYHFG